MLPTLSKQNWMTISLVTVLLLSITAVGATVSAEAQSTEPIKVAANGSDADFETIQAAVNQASPGQTIQVAAGTYTETVYINKSVNVVGDPSEEKRGVGPNAPVLDGEGREGSAIILAKDVSDITISGLVIENYTQTNLNWSEGNGVWAANDSIENITISDNRFEDLSGSAVAAGARVESANEIIAPTIEDITVRSNKIEHINQTAIHIMNSNNILVVNNKIVGGEDVFGDSSSNAIAIASRSDSGNNGTVKNVEISDNLIEGSYYDAYALIEIYSYSFDSSTSANMDSVTVTNNDINPTDTSYMTDGIQFKAANRTAYSDAKIEQVKVAGNSITQGNSGIGIYSGIPTNRSFGNSVISNVSIGENYIESTYHDSIYVAQNGEAKYNDIRIVDNSIRDGKAGIANWVHGEGVGKSIKINENTIWDSEFGVFVATENGGRLEKVNISRNTAINSSKSGVNLNALHNSSLGSTHVTKNTVRSSQDIGLAMYGQFNRGSNISSNVISHAKFGMEVRLRGDGPPHTFYNNTIKESKTRGIRFQETTNNANIEFHNNSIVDNTEMGLINNNQSTTVNATNNWWGDVSGPSSPETATVTDPVTGAVADGSGDAVSTGVHFDPWLESERGDDSTDGNNVSVSVGPTSQNVSVNETATVDIVAEDIDNGVSSYEFALSADNSSAAKLTDISLEGTSVDDTLTSVELADDGSSVTVSAGVAGHDSGTIATATVEGVAEGTTQLSLSGVALGDTDANSYTIGTVNNARMSVVKTKAPSVVGDSSAQDLDGDGTFEDVNGDNTFDIVDVSAFFQNYQSQTVKSNTELFDFNNDGTVDIVDVSALFGEAV